MEKVNFTFNEVREPKKITLLGNEIEILPWLTQSEKETCAIEYSSMAVVIDEEKKMAHIGFGERFARAYAFCRAYTNISEESFIEQYNDTRIIDAILDTVCKCTDDGYIVIYMMDEYAKKRIEIYEKQNSLDARVNVALDGFLNGGDLTKLLSQDPKLNDVLIDVFATKKKKEIEDESTALLSQFAKKKD